MSTGVLTLVSSKEGPLGIRKIPVLRHLPRDHGHLLRPLDD